MGEGTQPTESGAQSHIIKRPRLTKLLDDSGARLILLVAPAGYGKTTLARQWLAAYRRPVAWYRATPASADVAALATGLAAEIDAAIADGQTHLVGPADVPGSGATTPRDPGPGAVAEPRALVQTPRRRHRRLPPDQRLRSRGDVRRGTGGTASGDLRDHDENAADLVHPAAGGLRRSTRGRNGRADDDRGRGKAGLRSIVRQTAATVHTRSRPRLASSDRLWPREPAEQTSRAKRLPRNLYEFLAEDLSQCDDARRHNDALTVLALTGTNERALIRELVGADADVALNEAEKRGLLTFESASRVALHPLFAEFLIERLAELGRPATTDIVDSLLDVLRDEPQMGRMSGSGGGNTWRKWRLPPAILRTRCRSC